ncbi:MAG: glycoside hydrolase family 97 protein [Thermoproteota archaeon]
MPRNSYKDVENSFMVNIMPKKPLGFQSADVSSPDHRILVKITIRERIEPYPSGKRLYYSISFRGKEILVDSPLAMDFKDAPPLARNLVLTRREEKTINEKWQAVHGKSKSILNLCNELHLWLREKEEPGRRLELFFRAYNDGVAFRYFLPRQPGMRSFKLTNERSEFRFTSNHTAWAADYGSYISPQEALFEKKSLRQITPSSIIGLPLLVKVDESRWVAITEANITDWAGMYLTGTGVNPYALVSSLSPRLDEPGVLVSSNTPHYSPWRVVMIGQSPGDLIESNIILNLNEPCEIRDTSWIKPGKAAWDWWCGGYIPDAKFKVGMNTDTMKYFIEFAAEMGFEYMVVDAGWYGEPNKPEADVTKPIPELNIHELIKFANEKNVRIIVWLDWRDVERKIDEAFQLYEKWGIAGVKIDYMDRDDQEMVNFYHKVLKEAAEHCLLVEFHGAYKPDGLQRTYPNLITREGVLGNEYNKWSSLVTPEHTVTIPFTRMLAGPMDFTPGGFRHATKTTFRPRNTGPFVMGTRCHQLAMLVVYESPLQVLCDSPYNYRGQPGLDFLRIVPTTWDETRFLNGEVGEYITIARKHGSDWFVGSMTNWEPREIEIPLGFLGDGKYVAHVFEDAPEADDFPDRVCEKRFEVTSRDILVARMASGGGYVAHIFSVAKGKTGIDG